MFYCGLLKCNESNTFIVPVLAIESQLTKINKPEKLYEHFLTHGFHNVTYIRVLGNCNLSMTVCGFAGPFISVLFFPFSKMFGIKVGS